MESGNEEPGSLTDHVLDALIRVMQATAGHMSLEYNWKEKRQADGRKTLLFPSAGIQEGIGINLGRGFKGKVDANYPHVFIQHRRKDSSA